MAQAPAAPSTRFMVADLDRLTADLNRDGICVLRGLFGPELIREWRRAFDALYEQRQNRPGGLAPREQSR